MKSKHYIYNHSDRLVMVFLLTLALTGIVLMFLVGGNGADTTASADSTAVATKDRNGNFIYARPMSRHACFAFDPNTADSTQLLRLGLQPWQVRSIYKYRAAGGVFRRKEDFARLYGLTKKQYEELAPYIRIGSDYQPAADYYGYEKSEYGGGAARTIRTENDTIRHYDYPHKLSATEHVNLNLADTNLLKRVPGIGSYWARRIINYRDRLGGFVSQSQLMEIDDEFPKTAIPYLKIALGSVRKMNVNTLTLGELKHHPYIHYYQAKAIVDYRRLRGPIHSLNDLRLCKDFPPEEIKRLEPYVTF